METKAKFRFTRFFGFDLFVTEVPAKFICVCVCVYEFVDQFDFVGEST